jgi:hypothetical protein
MIDLSFLNNNPFVKIIANSISEINLLQGSQSHMNSLHCATETGTSI